MGQLEALGCDTNQNAHANHCPSFSPETELVLAAAKSESGTLGHGYIGTEHLALGLLKRGNNPASDYLQRNGITFEQLRKQVLKILAG
ncbi:MAG TPA: Clp protease N-terminal domain-containing protein [Planctomycetaceae bacterium]|nr:Clp protease N-terminal domain-containing protein [Planctomycetaceae bacterium]